MNEIDKLIRQLIKEEGGTKSQYLHLLNSISNHETGGTNDPTTQQKGGGPGRGKYQFEEGNYKGGITAARRLRTYYKNNNMPVPEWLNKATQGKSLDASTLTSEQQDALFLGNMKMHPKADLAKVMSNEVSVPEFWANYHWAGPKKQRQARLKDFNSTYIEMFDPEGDGYDIAKSNELKKLYPLTTPKPGKYIGDYINDDNSHQSWVWHDDEKDYFLHNASRDSRTGQLLKGQKHETYDKTVKGEKEAGYQIYKGQEGKYYSKPDARATTPVPEQKQDITDLKKPIIKDFKSQTQFYEQPFGPVNEGGTDKNFPKYPNQSGYELLNPDFPGYRDAVNSSRDGVRKNTAEQKGDKSSHIMMSGEADGRYYAYPSLYQNKDKSWYEPKDPFKEGVKKKEVYEFDTQEAAESFAKGSWKPNEYAKGGSMKQALYGSDPTDPPTRQQMITARAKKVVSDYKDKQNADALKANREAFNKSSRQATLETAKEGVKKNFDEVNKTVLWNLPGMISPLAIEDLALAGLGKGAKFLKNTKAGKQVTDKVADFISDINWGKWNKEMPENKALMDEYLAIEQQAKADGTWMKNPDGTEFKGSNPTQKEIIDNPMMSNDMTPEEAIKAQFVQQRSNNLKNWFENSKVVDSKGNPEINYHSTYDDFDEFDISKFDKSTNDGGFHGKGHYTSGNKQWSKTFGDKVLQGYLKIENPIPNKYNHFFGREGLGSTPDFGRFDIQNKFGNYDGVIEGASDYRFNERVFKKPSSFKSALGNNGMFDMANPNIYKALAAPVGLGTVLANGNENTKALGGYMKQDLYGREFNPFNGGGDEDPPVKKKDNTNIRQPYVKEFKNFKTGIPVEDPTLYPEGSHDRKKAELFSSDLNRTPEIFNDEYEFLKNWFGSGEFKKRLTQNIADADASSTKSWLTKNVFQDTPEKRATELQKKTARSLAATKLFSTDSDVYNRIDELSKEYAKLNNETEHGTRYREVMTAGQFNPSRGIGWLDTYKDIDKMKGTYVHEKTHGTPMDDFYSNKGEKSKKFKEAEAALKRRYGEDFNLVLQRGWLGNSIFGKKDKTFLDKAVYLSDEDLAKAVSEQQQEKFKYLERSTEVYPRLMYLRYKGNLKPGQIVDDEMIEELSKTKDDIFRIYSKEQVKNMLNTYADNSKINQNQNVSAYGGSLRQSLYGREFNSFNEGGTHEANPNGGIPLGVGDNGKQNTVEQGESSYNFKSGKYIFSDRITI